MRVLVACEFSGVVRDAFASLGHDAYSCDLLPTERPGNHFQCDVREVLHDGWDLLIAHPDCTYITNSGVRWLYRDIDRWPKCYEACQFFRELWEADIPRVCIENPVPHKYGLGWIGAPYTQTVQPWQFGHPETKRTALWLRGLPPLEPTADVRDAMRDMPKNQTDRVHYASPGPDRWKERARTFPGIAAAMAAQWSEA